MSIITASLSDTLPLTVPLLNASGSNWAIFVFRFQDAVEAKGFWDHFDGSASRPIAASATPTAAETIAMTQWDKDERSARSLLTQKLPDSTVVLIHGKKTVRERWEAVVREFSKKSAYAQADLRAKFMGMQCPERGNPREFLEVLRVKKEEMAQAGVVVDEKDYFSVIISSLPVALSNFASNQLAAAQFLSSRSMTPDDLLSMLMEESDCQRAQWQRRQGSGKGRDQEREDEALAAGALKPRKGRANVTCWTCDKVGHYSYECEEPSESDDDSKDEEKALKDDPKNSTANDATVATIESDEECGGAWAAEEVVMGGPLSISEVADELDWFEMAIVEMGGDAEMVTEEISVRDWFNEVVEGEKELRDNGASLKNAVVECFDKDASRRAFVEDSNITGLIWPCCDDIEGTGMLPSTLLGLFTLVVDREVEYEGGRTTCDESSGMEPDLDSYGDHLIDATMEWSNHAIALRTSVEVVTHSLDNPREGEGNPDVQVHESCDVGGIGVTRDLEGPEMFSTVYEGYPLVPRFEGEKDDRCETKDLPAAEYPTTPVEFPTGKIFDPSNCTLKTMCECIEESPPSVLDILMSRGKFFEGSETRRNAGTTHTLTVCRFEPLSAIMTHEEGQGGFKNINRVGGPTLVDAVHLEHPSGHFSMTIKPPTIEIVDPGDFAPKMTHENVEESLVFVTSTTVGCVKYIEGTEAVDDEWVVSVAVVRHLGPSLAIGTYEKGWVDEESLYRGGGLTLDDIAHLLRPPGCVLKRCWLKEGC